MVRASLDPMPHFSVFFVKFRTPLNPILSGVFYIRWLGGVVQNYPKSLNKGNKLISHKTFQNTSTL